MKKYIYLLIVVCISYLQEANAQVTISLSPHGAAEICNNNIFNGTITIPQPYPISFDFKLKAIVKNGSSQIISLPNPNYPLCGDQVTNNINPAQVDFATPPGLPNCIQISPTPQFDPINNEYTWTFLFNSCPNSGDIIIDFSYAVFLDCGLIPTIQPVSNQQQYSLEATGTIAPSGINSTQTFAIAIPFIADMLVPGQGQAVHFDGNYGQTVEMIFEYKNVGFAPLTIDFTFTDFYLNNCANPGYELDANPLFYAVSASIPTYAPFNGSLSNQFVDVNETVYIKQRIHITGCTNPTINPCAGIDKKVIFNWRCTNAPISNSQCATCQRSYETPFKFDYEVPEFTVELNQTAPIVNADDYDYSCITETQIWTVKVSNISTNAGIGNVHLTFNNPSYANSLSVIRVNSLTGSSITVPNSLPLPFAPATAAFVTPIAAGPTPAPCNTGLNYTVNDFEFDINNLYAGEEAYFTFETEKCDDYTGLLNVNKAFNQWTVISKGNTICGDNEFNPTATANDLPKNITGGISSHSNTDSRDLNLTLNFSAANNHLDGVIPPTLPPQNYGYGIANKGIENIIIDDMFGDELDRQVLGLKALGQSQTDVKGILKVTIHCETGLIIDWQNLVTDVMLRYKPFGLPYTTVPIHAFYTSNPVNASNYDPNNIAHQFPNCIAADYDLYYDLGAIASISPSEFTEFLTTAFLQFSLTPCCPIISTPTDYNVTFSILPTHQTGGAACNVFNSQSIPPSCSSGNCNWIPLSSSGWHVSIHCPGCEAPGIVVEEYRMFRNSFGYPDVIGGNGITNGDRMPDNTTLITDPVAFEQATGHALNRDAAVHGDEVVDYDVSRFQPGNPSPFTGSGLSCPTDHRGYSYNSQAGCAPPLGDMLNDNIELNVLQLYRTITNGGCSKMGLEILEIDLYVDNGASINCVGCLDGIFPQYNNVNTLIHFNVLPQGGGISTHYVNENSTGNDKEIMFTFRRSDFIAPGNGGTRPYLNPIYASANDFVFEEGQQIRLRVRYRVNGNTSSAYWPIDASQLHLTSDVNDWMWFTGGVSNPDGFTLANHNGVNQMPNLFWESSVTAQIDMVVDNNISFSTCTAPTPCGSTTTANQTNMGDEFKFFCEPRGGTFHFYSTDCINNTTYGDYTPYAVTCTTTNADKTICLKKVSINAISSFGRGMYNPPYQTVLTGAAGFRDLFPFEYRTPSLLPHTFNLSNIPIADYTFYNASPFEPKVYSLVYDYNYNPGGFVTCLNSALDDANAPGGLTFTQGSALGSGDVGLLNCMTVVPANTSTDLIIGDEKNIEYISLFFEPNCQTAPAYHPFSVVDSEIEFGEVNTACPPGINAVPAVQPSCGTEGLTKTNEALAFMAWYQPNPNLNMQFSPAQIQATTGTVCWHFDLTNQAISGATAAYNVFIEVPTGINALTSWNLQNCTYNGQTITNTLAGNILPLFPNASYSNLPTGPYIVSGDVCATYTGPCLGAASLNFNWGWSCNSDFTNICSSYPTVQVALEDLLPNVQVVPNSQLVNGVSPTTPSLILCDPNQTFEAEFINWTAGEATAMEITFAGMLNISIAQVELFDCNNGSILATLPTAPWVLPQQSWAILGAGECIGVRATFTPLCQFGEDMQLPDIVLNFNAYCETTSIPQRDIAAHFDPVEIFGTICQDCFSITKTASVSQAANGTEIVSYTIQICSNNDPSIGTYNVTVNEGRPPSDPIPYIGYPAGYAPVAPDPFNGGGATLNYTFNYPHINPYCITIIEPGNNPMQGTLGGTGTVGSTICNEVYLTNLATTTTFTDTACTEILPNCQDLYSGTVIISGTNLNGLIVAGQNYIVQGTVNVNGGSVLFDNNHFYFEPGAEINVQGILDIQRNSILEGCSKMWRGITLQNGSTLNVNRSTVNDAYNSTYANSKTVVSYSDSYFNDNYLSLYIPPTGAAPQVKPNKTAVNIYYTTFNGSGAMLPMFQCIGCSTVSNLIPKAALEVNDVTIKVNSCCGINFYTNMSNGIIGYRSNLLLENNVFSQIHADPVYLNQTTTTTGTSYNGSPIYGTGTTATGTRVVKIEQVGFGNQQGVSQITFDGCDYSIFADAIELISHQNIMVDIGIAAYYSQLAERQTIITDNVIDAINDGIVLIAFDAARTTIVENNEIAFGDGGSGGNFSCAIRAEGTTPIYQDVMSISRNIINYRSQSTNAFSGIFANTTNGLHIVDNELTMSDNTVNYQGIAMTNCDNIITSCNRVHGDGVNYDAHSTQSAISLFNGTDPEVGCNTVDGTSNGVYVFGTVTVNTSEFLVEGNDFNNHAYGLRYGLATTAGAPIDYRGNRWNVNQPSVLGGLHAWNQNTNNWIPYSVNSSTLPLLPTFQIPSNWFNSAGGPADFQCNIPNDYCENIYPPQMANGVTDMDRLIASDTLENDPYTDETRWILKKELYAKIEENPIMLNDNLISQFYLNNQGSIFAQLKPIEEAKAELFLTDSLTDTLLVQNQNLIEQNAEDLGGHINLLDTAIVYNDTATITVMLDIITTEQEAMQQNMHENDSINAEVMAERTIAADDISSDNASLSTGNIIEDNERAVNDIYLNTIAKGIYLFTQAQRIVLYNIAIQCPMAGGNAVFRARALYALLNKNQRYNDFEICALEGIALRKAKKNVEEKENQIATVYPNPATDKAYLAFDLPTTETVKFILSSISGQRIFEMSLAGGKQIYGFSTKALMPGVYHYALICNGNGVENGKLVIIK